MLKITKASIKEIPILCNLLNLLFSQEVEFLPNKELQEKGLQTIIESDSLGDIFVVKKNDEIIAMVNILYTYSTALGSKVAMLEDMVVEPQSRGENIGSKLLDYVMKYLKENDFKRVTLLTDDDNLNAHKFYEKNSFEVSSMVPYRKML